MATPDPFLQRALEHWLDSANELTYQSLFCEWLVAQGYSLKYSIGVTILEQGKDVVAVNPQGVPCAYQLKGRNISLKRWRDEVKPEVEALIDCAIQHPDIDSATPHESYLVTNGEIDDTVRHEIVATNEGKWRASPLRVLTRGDLIAGFLQIVEGILPKDAQMYKDLADLMFADGNGLPNLDTVSQFLSTILKVGTSGLTMEQRKRDIAAALLYANIIAGPYRRSGNHAAVVRVMTVLLSLTLYTGDAYALPDEYWLGSYEIVWRDILATAALLDHEVSAQGFTASMTPLDSELIAFRKHAAVSIIYALRLSRYVQGDTQWEEMLKPEVAKKYQSTIVIWGEASLVPMILLAILLKDQNGARDAGIGCVKRAAQLIVEHNGRKSKSSPGLISPYYDLDFAVKLRFGLLDHEFEDSCRRSSYLLKPLVELLAAEGEREFVSEYWQEVSFFQCEEFIPSTPTGYYLWRAETGENLTVLPKAEKSWAELMAEANANNGSNLPPSMARFPAFLPFFLAVFPHRVNSRTLGFLRAVVTSLKPQQLQTSSKS